MFRRAAAGDGRVGRQRRAEAARRGRRVRRSPESSATDSPCDGPPRVACGPWFANRPVSPHAVGRRRRLPRARTRCNGYDPHRLPVLCGTGRVTDGPASRLSVTRHRSLETFPGSRRRPRRHPLCPRPAPHARPIPPASRTNPGRQGGGNTGRRPRCREKNMRNYRTTRPLTPARVRWAGERTNRLRIPGSRVKDGSHGRTNRARGGNCGRRPQRV
jgi:hypothetical protein